jgi:hypothetical protein
LDCHVIQLIRATRMKDDSQDEREEFRRFARECLRLAERVQSVDDKAALLSMAQVWIRLADQGFKVRRLTDGTAHGGRLID